ncbi:MAG: plastocyanin/azurin family copper-binding protein [Myxococcota bacterium]
MKDKLIDTERRDFLRYLAGTALTAPLLISAACQNNAEPAGETPTAPSAPAPEPDTPEAAPKADPDSGAAPSGEGEGGGEAAANGETKEFKLEVGDSIKYSTDRLEVASGSTVNLTIEHTGKLPKEAMGHNFVLLKAGTDKAAFANAAMAADATAYIPDAMKDSVLANTKVVGGGESDTISFTAPAAGEYDYICTFPGHYTNMQGKLVVT